MLSKLILKCFPVRKSDIKIWQIEKRWKIIDQSYHRAEDIKSAIEVRTGSVRGGGFNIQGLTHPAKLHERKQLFE